MANGSDIVQTIKIEVDGAEEAAAEIKKIGEATEEVQQTAAASAGGTRELGTGLDEVTKKSGFTRGEMRALGGVMRQLGAGEAAGLALQFNKMRGAFGTVGVAVLGAAMAFSALMRSVKEAKEASESVERLSRSLSDTPERLQAMQSAFKAAGVAIADFEKGFDALAFKVIERSASMAEAAAASSKKVVDAELAAAQAAQAASPRPELFEQQIKRLKVSQAQEAAYLAEAQAAKAYANSQAALVPQLERAAQGQKTVLDAGVKTESIMDSLIQMFAKGGQSVAGFGDNLQKGAPSAQKMSDTLNTLFNSLDPAAQLKLKTGLKGLGIPDSVVNTITTTTEKYAKLKKAADDAAKFNASDAGKALAEFNAAVERSQKTVEGWAQTLKIKFTEAVLGWKKILSGGFGFFGQVLAEAGRQAVGGLGSIGTSIARAVAAWVTTAAPNAWQWIVNTFNAAVAWISTKVQEGRAAVLAWVSTAPGSAWQWIKNTFNLAVAGISAAASAVASSIVAFVTTAPGAAWRWLVDTFNAAVEWISSTASSVAASILAFVTEAPGQAWQWIVDTFNAAVAWISSTASSVKTAVVAFVTEAPGNAWQWLVDKFNEALAAIAQKWAAFKAIFSFGGGAAPEGAAAGGQFAGGGLLGGRGTGTSDSNLAWVSRGEHIMPARAVSQPGVLAFLEALRRSGGSLRDVLDGMGRFALGGMVRAPIAIPAFAGGGMSRDLGTLTLGLPGGGTVSVQASSAVVDELRKAAAMAQVRSGGRKPSRYS